MVEKELTDAQAHKIFWESYNKKCLECDEKCKQSSKVEILSCGDKKKR